MNTLGIVKIRVHITKPNGKMLWPWAIKPADFLLHSIFTISVKISAKVDPVLANLKVSRPQWHVHRHPNIPKVPPWTSENINYCRIILTLCLFPYLSDFDCLLPIFIYSSLSNVVFITINSQILTKTSYFEYLKELIGLMDSILWLMKSVRTETHEFLVRSIFNMQ